MNSNQSTSSSQPEEDIDEFLYKDTRKFNKDPVIKWGPKDDTDHFLQQTVNCLDACKMAIECTFSGMPQESIQAEWDKIANSHGNNRSLDPNFVRTYVCKIKAKSMESNQLTSQQFWMFRSVNHKEIYVVFSSQETSAYILSNADIWKMPRQKDIAPVDDIPISLFKSLLQQADHLIFTGHSLGGAIAILATYKLIMKDLSSALTGKIRCITFGAPLVSYQDLGEIIKLNKIIFRYELPEDPVPQLLTAFQRVENPYQEFLVNLMNLLGLQNSFKHENDVDFGFRDFLELSEFSVDEIKKIDKLGTLFVPQNQNIVLSKLNSTQYYMNHNQEWRFLQNLNLDESQSHTKLVLSEFIGKLQTEHQFERYEQQLFNRRLSKINLPNAGGEPIAGDMVQVRIPESNQWTNNTSNLAVHPNQVEAFFDERYTQVIVKSKHPHILGIRSCEIQQFPQWGIVASEILEDGGVYKIMFKFRSGYEYKTLRYINSLITIRFCGCFEIVENIEVEAKSYQYHQHQQQQFHQAVQFWGRDVSWIRSSAYENMNLQQLYNSAFQACLFAGEGHNPMLQAQNQSDNQRDALLQDDYTSLVELLGSLIVNQQCLEIILQKNKWQYQTKLARNIQLDTYDEKFLQGLQIEKTNKKLVDLAKTNLSEIYNKFKYDPTYQQQGAKDCVKESTPTLLSLSCSLIWQMKMILWGKSAILKTGGAGLALGGLAGLVAEAGVAVASGGGAAAGASAGGGAAAGAAAAGGGAAAGGAAAAGGGAAAAGLAAAGVIGLAVGAATLIAFGLDAVICSLNETGVAFKDFFKSSQEMQKQYKEQLTNLLKKLGYELQDYHSVAILEREITELCQRRLKQEEIHYEYNYIQNELNRKILLYIWEKNAEQERIKEELKTLIIRKVDYLVKILKDYTQNVDPHALAALFLFIQNNYRIRFCLSKTLRIGVMGAKNAGKSTLCKLLGCAIESTGQNSSTDDPTLYQNIPTNGFCVVDFPHLDQNCTEANNTMKVFYSLSDIAIIVMKSQDRADQQQQNREVCEIIKAIQRKYKQMGYENTNWRFPVLLLFNQAEMMIFNEDSKNDPDDDTLTQNFERQKQEIIDKFKDYNVYENKVYFLFACLKPQLPKPTEEKIKKWNREKRNQEKNLDVDDEEGYDKLQQEFLQKIQSADKERLRKLTSCSFFKSEQDHQENPQSIVSILAKMVKDFGDRQGTHSIIDRFRTNNQ